MTLQHIANGLMGNRKPEIGQGAYNPIKAPVPVFMGHANNELLELSLDAGSSRTSTGLPCIKFAGDELAVPGQIVSGLATAATSARASRPRR